MNDDNPDQDFSLFRRIFERLGARRLAYVMILVLTVFLFTVGLQIMQFGHMEESLGFGTSVELLRSRIFVTVAFATLALGLCLVELRRWLWYLGMGLLQLLAAFSVFANVVGYFFYQGTGSALNWRIFLHGLTALRDSPEVIHSEVPGFGWVLLGAGLLMALALPPALAWLVARWRPDDGPKAGAETGLGVVCLVAALISFGVAAIPAAHLDYEVGFSRDTGVHLFVTSLGQSSSPGDDVDPWFDISEIHLRETDHDGPTNVAVIILESVRASAMTPYNPELDTTPFLDELADDSLFFEQAYAMVPHTSKALVAMLCGVPPRIVMEIAESRPGGGPGRCMPTLLGDLGYRSIFMQSATEQFEARRGLVANMGFDDFTPIEEMDTHGFEEANYFGYEDDVMLGPSKTWLQARGDQPFMSTYLTITPHHDYLAPRTYGRFEFDDYYIFNRYLNSVRYIDHFVENLIAQYKELGLYDSTLFVIVGDHGEAFGEHGRDQHDNVPWQEGIHIPLIIHDGSASVQPERYAEPISHIDLAPTIFDRLGLEIAGGDYPGYVATDVNPERLVYFSCWYDDQCAGFLHGGHKYIHHFGNRRDEVFDLLADPREQNNLIADHTVVDQETTSIVFEWADAVDAAYDAHFQRVINRRVLAQGPGFANSSGEVIGDALKIIGYEWEQPRDDGPPSLVIGLEVLRNFRLSDEAAIIIDDGSAAPLTYEPLRGTYPPLFWRQGQILIEEVRGDVLERAQDQSATIKLTVGDQEATVTDVELP